MILEKDYGVFYWCKAQLTDTEFANFVRHLTEMKIADGADFETKEVCFKFAQARPKTIGDIKKAKEIITKVLQSNEKVLKDPMPVVAVKDLTDNAIHIAIRPWATNEDFPGVSSQILEDCKTAFDQEGISIQPFIKNN